MPHTHTFIRDTPGNPALLEYGADPAQFTTKVASIVAEAFNSEVGEALEPQVSSKSYPAIVSKSCPVELVLDVVAWSDDRRAKGVDAVRLSIETRVSEWLEGRPACVLVSLVPRLTEE